MWHAAPADVADAGNDASAFLGVGLWLAMRRHEDLEVVGPVSPALLDRTDEIQDLYCAWDPTMARVVVRARAGDRRRARGRATAFFSRGVDSTFAAARDRSGPRRLDALVFGDRLEPRHDDAIRAHEIVRAAAAADRLELPLVVTESNVRAVMDPMARDWEDAVAPGLSFLAHNLAGGVRSAVIPSADDYVSLEPSGTGPLLDPLFSTERVTIAHDTPRWSRLQKLEWLTHERPDLLDTIKVCFKENRPDNCGVCGKCLLNIACLHITGGLARAREFPATLDVDAIGRMKLPHLKARLEWAEVAASLSQTQTDRDLRDTILEVLRASAIRAPEHPAPGGPLWVDPTSIRNHRLNLILSLVLEGRPYAGGDGEPDS